MAISPWGEEVPSPKIVINLSRTHETYIIKDNHKGSLVSEIFHNRQVERHTNRKKHPITCMYKVLQLTNLCSAYLDTLYSIIIWKLNLPNSPWFKLIKMCENLSLSVVQLLKEKHSALGVSCLTNEGGPTKNNYISQILSEP